MSDIRLFESKEFGSIRTAIINERIYFAGSDVAKALGYSNVRDAISRHCKGVVKHDTPTSGGVQLISYISEGDLYRLIAKSKLPNAEKFEVWVFDEVLPSIRKNGGYVMNQENLTPEQIVANAVIVAQNIIREKDKQIAEIQPKAEYCDTVLNKQDLINTTTIAKDLGFRSAKKLNDILHRCRIIYKDNTGNWQPYAEYEWLIEYGYADYKSYTDANVKPAFKWTEMGRRWIIENIEKWTQKM